jgi:transcriptional regulator with XRE-family HTH domain/ribosomal protein S15P/S13E
MTEAGNTQVLFFQHIKSLLPSHVSMVDEIADILEISNDSAYRRIRGEKPISIEEMQKLAGRYRISLDQFMHLESDSFIFSGNLTSAESFNFEDWLQSVLKQMQFMNSFKKKHLYILTKDIPFFELHQLPELGAFKFFFWKKSILHYEEMKGAKFTVNDLNPAHAQMGKKIIEVYNQISSTEIWNIESINTTIRQIEFYREANVFGSAEDVQCLYNKINELLDHLEKQAELGVKFSINQQPLSNAGSYTMLVNEVILGDNTFHAILDDKKVTYLNHSVINFIMTQDETFTNYMQGALENLMKKSMQISVLAEKQRTRFFNRLRDKIRLSARL